ncbi:MAG: glycosyltransferase [Parcubacteria group bacterium]|nr:glycosyltransferase [Parcubacteria group bacterium]
MPRVSVIMNCLNCEQYLKEAIDSVYNQTYKDWEIIFWDNASTDNSAKIAKSYDDKIRYFKSDTIDNLGKARNFAIEQACGEYLAFLDCDDVWLAQKLEKQIQILESDSKIGLVYSDAFVFSNQKVLYSFYKKDRPLRGNIFGQLLENYILAILTVVIRKDILMSLTHWFDDSLTMDEDMDLFLRIAHDWKVDYVDEVLAKYRIHSGNESYKKLHLIPKEEEVILEKLNKLYPEDMSVRYLREADVFRKNIDCHWAMSKWQEKDRVTARKYLRPYIFKKKTCLIIYFIMDIPYSLFRFLTQLYYKVKYGR